LKTHFFFIFWHSCYHANFVDVVAVPFQSFVVVAVVDDTVFFTFQFLFKKGTILFFGERSLSPSSGEGLVPQPSNATPLSAETSLCRETSLPSSAVSSLPSSVES